jgi:hypothetical protein
MCLVTERMNYEYVVTETIIPRLLCSYAGKIPPWVAWDPRARTRVLIQIVDFELNDHQVKWSDE